MAVGNVATVSVVYAGRLGLFVEPGTYRAEDGRLVHCRRSVGVVALEIEGDDVASVDAVGFATNLVRLSDDPSWPDGLLPDAPSPNID